MKRAVVTGASGFIGSALVRELLHHGMEVFAVVRPREKQESSLQREKSDRLVSLDHEIRQEKLHLIPCYLAHIRELPALLPAKNMDVFYHFAWDGMEGDALTDYQKQLDNVRYTLDAVCAAAALGCQKFIGSGSSSQSELTVPEGRKGTGDKHSIFKTAKTACEYMGEIVAMQNGVEFIWPILSNPFGPGETKPRLINTTIQKILAGEHLSFSEGNQMYDFIYIDDAARAFRLIGESGRAGRHYVLSMGKTQALKNFLLRLIRIVDASAVPGFGETEFHGVYLPKEAFSNAQLVQDTGFRPQVTFEEGILRTMEWLKHV